MHPPTLTPSRPHAPEKKKCTTPRPIDPWHDWQPQWRQSAETQSPHKTQEKHSPTESVKLRNSGGREDIACRRRIVDARLWDSLPRIAQDAALEVASSYEALTKGLGAATSNPERVPGARASGSGDSAYGRLSGDYMDWARACQKEKISHSMVIDILCFGITCHALDRDRRVRAGTSKKNLYDGLMLYAKLRGWTARPC